MHGMTSYFIRRMLLIPLTFVCITFMVYAIMRLAPGGPIEQARTRHSSGGYGGLGIGLMLRCCDKVEYIPPGNIVKLTKYL